MDNWQKILQARKNMGEYLAYKKEVKKAGGTPLSFYEWLNKNVKDKVKIDNNRKD